MKITVVGLGKIGLPLAVQYASRGHQVIGADVNQRVVDQVNRGEEPFPGEHDLARRLALAVGDGLITATIDTAAAVAESDVVVVVVPLFVNSDDEPDFGWLDSATTDIGRGLKAHTLVIFETTLPVGITRGRWKPLLEKNSGLVEGLEFHLAFSPERVLTGRIFADLRKYPKLVGGLSEEGAKLAVAFYEDVLEFDDRPDLERDNGVWDLGSAEAAEMAKLAETTYRDVNIGLANQFAKYAGANGIDIYQVIEASNSQPYSHIHQPGIAVGGHCIPVYPRLYLWNDPEATVVRAAREANAGMPDYTVQMAKESYGDLAGTRVLVLGVSYREGVKETAFSGIFPIVSALGNAGAIVTVQDPAFTDQELRQLGFEPHVPQSETAIVILHTFHHQYRTIDEKDYPGVVLVIDGRNLLRPPAFAGTQVSAIGKGGIVHKSPLRGSATPASRDVHGF